MADIIDDLVSDSGGQLSYEQFFALLELEPDELDTTVQQALINGAILAEDTLYRAISFLPTPVVLALLKAGAQLTPQATLAALVGDKDLIDAIENAVVINYVRQPNVTEKDPLIERRLRVKRLEASYNSLCRSSRIFSTALLEAKQQLADALFGLGEAYTSVNVNRFEPLAYWAVKCFWKAFELTGHNKSTKKLFIPCATQCIQDLTQDEELRIENIVMFVSSRDPLAGDKLFLLSLQYLAGVGVACNISFGFALLQQASITCDAAKVVRGMMLSNLIATNGLPPNYEDALSLFEHARMNGYHLGPTCLACVLDRGKSYLVAEDKTIIDWYMKSACKGSPIAQFLLAEKILAVYPNDAAWTREAMFWLRLAAIQGHLRSRECLYTYHQLASMNPENQCRLALMTLSTMEPQSQAIIMSAIQSLLKAANNGSKLAKDAIYLYQEEADKNTIPRSIYVFSMMLLMGRHESMNHEDTSRAVYKLLCVAAMQGDITAQYNLATLLIQRRDLSQNNITVNTIGDEALTLLLKSGKSGHPGVLNTLAFLCVRNSEEMTPFVPEGGERYLLQLAVENGSTKAKGNLGRAMQKYFQQHILHSLSPMSIFGGLSTQDIFYYRHTHRYLQHLVDQRCGLTLASTP